MLSFKLSSLVLNVSGKKLSVKFTNKRAKKSKKYKCYPYEPDVLTIYEEPTSKSQIKYLVELLWFRISLAILTSLNFVSALLICFAYYRVKRDDKVIIQTLK